MAHFKNPSNPAQPQAGVYGWYAIDKNSDEICVYIGMAGKKKNMLLPKGTLFRGVSELQRNTFTSDSPNYVSLDTDFVVGTALLYYESIGYKCEWRHIDNDPSQEITIAKVENPILQHPNNCRIKREFRLFKSESGYWRERKKIKEGIVEAEVGIFDELRKTNCEPVN